MRRKVTLEEISDGKLYTSNDMVKAGCNDCQGCSACCRNMGKSLVLDPYDIYQMTIGLATDFMILLNGKIKLDMIDGVILPHMNMGLDGGKCSFLNEQGRCSIHSIRPGICRLFPLGRYYEDDGFKYILQTNECMKKNRTKVKVKAFLGIENLKDYEKYIYDWHCFLKDTEAKVIDAAASGNDAETKEITMSVLNTFFVQPYSKGDFYEQYYRRREMNCY